MSAAAGEGEVEANELKSGELESGDVKGGIGLAPAPSIFAGELRTISAGLLILVTLIAFEAMSVTAAMPTAARDLHGIGAYGWVITGFLVANVFAMVVSGVVSDRRGPRIPLSAGLVFFLAGLLVAGSAQSMWQLVLGRVVQGLGAGLILTAMYVVIGELYPPNLRPRFFAAISSAWVLPSLLGPPVAGAITQHLSWRIVFLGLVPLVAIGAALMLPSLRAMTSRDRGYSPAVRRRLVSALGAAVAIAALEQAGQHPKPLWLALAVPGVALLVWSLRALLPDGTVTIRPGVPTAVAFRGMLASSFFGIDSLIPLSLTVQHHYSPTAAALPLLGSSVGWSVGSWIQSRYAHGSRQVLIRAAFVLISVGGVGTAFSVVPSGAGWLAYPAWALAGVGMGIGMSTASLMLLDYTTDADRGRDSAALQLSDGVLSAITTGVGGILVAAAARGALGYTTAFVVIDLVMVAICLVGVAFAGRARRLTSPQ